MKKLLSLMLFAVALIAPIFATAAPPGQFDSEFGFVASKHKSAAVVSVKLGEVVKPLGWKMNLDVISYAGVSDVAVGGFAVAGNFKVAENVALKIGPGLNFSTGQKPIPCAYFSMSWRL